MRYCILTTGLGYNKQSKMPAIIFCFSFLLLAQTQRGGTSRKELKKSCQFLEKKLPIQGVLCPYTIVLHQPVLTGIITRSLGTTKMWGITQNPSFYKSCLLPTLPSLCLAGLRLLAIYPMQTLLVKRVCCFVFKALSLQEYKTLLFQLQGCLGGSQSL